MTIAISLKVNEGVILAADSATTIIYPNGQIENVYNHANKVINLRKGLPIGAVTWGLGNIGPFSIATLLKDLRVRFTKGEDKWKIQPENYKMEDVANLVREFIYEEKYLSQFPNDDEKHSLGLYIVGYSSDGALAEEYRLDIRDRECKPPLLMRPVDQAGASWNGEPEAIQRLLLGYGSGLATVFEVDLGVDVQVIPEIIKIISKKLSLPIINPSMPIQDAIDLAVFLAELTSTYKRFAPGHQTVGGMIEVAAITKHEGYRWVRRKHYYSREFNPELNYE